MNQQVQKKKQGVVTVKHGEKGWVGATPKDHQSVINWCGKHKAFIPYGQEQSAQDNAWLSNKKIVFNENIR